MKEMQQNIYNKAFNFRTENSHKVDTWEDFKEIINGTGGFVYAHWDGTQETEQKIKEETKATIRCIPLDSKEEPGKCVFSGNPSSRRVLFAKAY